MRKARTVMLEQGTQTPSPAPDLIPAETKNQARTNIRIGTANGGTSVLSHVVPNAALPKAHERSKDDRRGVHPKEKANLISQTGLYLCRQRPTLPHTWRVQYHRPCGA